jgi:hypothetical protein
VGFVVKKLALGHVFSEYFGFPCQFSFHQLLLSSTLCSLDTDGVVKQQNQKNKNDKRTTELETAKHKISF